MSLLTSTFATDADWRHHVECVLSTLSRWRHGFESRWGYRKTAGQRGCRVRLAPPLCVPCSYLLILLITLADSSKLVVI